MANISKWFGYPIYITKLENFEEINKKIVPIILRDITPTNSQYEQGNLFLLDDDAHKVGLNVPKRDPYFTEWNQSNYGKAEYPAETGNVIIFPSMMFHETGKNTKDEPRISISGDIMLTMKEGIKSEHNIPSPATWKKL